MRHVVLALIVALAAGGCALFTDFSDLSDASDPPAGPDDASTPAEAASPSPVEIVASGQVRPTALTLHQGQLYWVDAAPNAGIMTTRVGANMSPSVIARTSETPSSVAIGGGLLFWSLPNAGEVWEASPTGQGAKAITDSHAGAQSLVHAGTLYWLTTTHLHYCESSSKPCCGCYAVGGLVQPASLSLAGNTLVYAHSGGTAISSFDPNGSEATLLASNLSSVQAVTGDASSYYAAADDAILTGSLSAPETPRVLASGLPSPLAVAVAGEDVYFTCVGDGSVRRVPKRGGDVDVIATGLSTPTSIVADGTHLYVASTGDGTVVRVPRR